MRTALLCKYHTCQTEASAMAGTGASFDAVIELIDVGPRGQRPLAIRVADRAPTFVVYEPKSEGHAYLKHPMNSHWFTF